MAVPTFHSMGILFQVVYPLMSSQPITLFEPQWPAPPVVPNMRNTIEAGRLTGATGVIATPSFLEVNVAGSCNVALYTEERLGMVAR